MRDEARWAFQRSRSALGPLDHADHDIAQRGKPAGDNPQRHGLPGTRLPRDQREAPFLDELFDAPCEVVDPGSHQQSLAGELRREWVPFQAPQREQFLGVHEGSPVVRGGVLGK